ncbi:MAG: type II secretion system protein [Candidatus Omnitrophica bacterium]|nr:type II secretion system protein [Candidatus Omnitrophota bacterium]
MMRMGREGFTLVEVMAAMMVFAVVMVGLAGVFLGVARLGESSRHLNRAMADARTVLDAIRDGSASGLAGVTGTNWTTWSQVNGLTSLPSEAVTVTYVNQAADPLSVTIQVSWLERGRTKRAAVDTVVTRR